jgi:hypothetical protein
VTVRYRLRLALILVSLPASIAAVNGLQEAKQPTTVNERKAEVRAALGTSVESARKGVLPPASWGRPYKEPGSFHLPIPITMPISSLKEELARNLPDTLAQGKEPVKLSKIVDQTVDKVIDILIPEVIRVPDPSRPKFKWILGHPFPDGFETKEIIIQHPGKKTIKEVVKKTLDYDVELTYRVTPRKDTLSVSLVGNQLKAELELDYTVDSSVIRQASIPIAPPTRVFGRLFGTIERSLDWDNSGKLMLSGGATTVRWAPGGPHVDLENVIRANVLLEIFKKQVNDVVEANMRKYVMDMGQLLPPLCRAIKLGNTEFRLLLRPLEVTPWKLTTDERIVHAGLTVLCKPQVIVLKPGDREPADSELPKIKPAQDRPTLTTNAPEIECLLPHWWLSKQLIELLATKDVGAAIEKAVKSSGEVSFGDPRFHPAGDADKERFPSALGRVRLDVPIKSPAGVKLAVSSVLSSNEHEVWVEDADAEIDLDDSLALLLLPLKNQVESAKAAVARTLNTLRRNVSSDIAKLTGAERKFDGTSGSLTFNLTLTFADHKLKELYVNEDELKMVVGLTCTGTGSLK